MRGGLLVAAVVFAAVASAATAAPDGVTLSVQRFYDPASRNFKLRFSGAISGGAANEYVTVLAQQCGQNFSTAVAGASTREGGSWEVETFGGGSATYRARWNGRVSAPVKVRPPVSISVSGRKHGGRYRIGVSPGNTPQSMSGRYVELQRLAGGRWTLFRRARLTAYGGQGFGTVYWAEFTIRARGLTLRVAIPATSASPCFTSTVSRTWRS